MHACMQVYTDQNQLLVQTSKDKIASFEQDLSCFQGHCSSYQLHVYNVYIGCQSSMTNPDLKFMYARVLPKIYSNILQASSRLFLYGTNHR